jgi:hypothetical protein
MTETVRRKATALHAERSPLLHAVWEAWVATLTVDATTIQQRGAADFRESAVQSRPERRARMDLGSGVPGEPRAAQIRGDRAETNRVVWRSRRTVGPEAER